MWLRLLPLLPLYLFAVLTTVVSADSLRRERCECCARCNQVCRLVESTQKEVKFCYDVKCEDFCLPGRSCIIGEKCVQDPCSNRSHREPVWKPSCGQVRTRNVLIKSPVTIERKVYRCVVEKVCADCGTAQLDSEATARLAASYPEFSSPIIPVSAEVSLDEFESLAAQAAVVHAAIPQADIEPRASLGDTTVAAETPAPRTSWLQRWFAR